MASENNSEQVKDQLINTLLNDQNSAETIEALVVGQIFHDWEELDRFISLYAKTQNFVSVIRGSEYDKGVCRIRRYACEHQGNNSILGITSLCLNHNDHPINNQTNKFALKYQGFSENILKDIRFWTEIDLSNIIQSFNKRENHIECEAAFLLNYFLERKAEDTRWIINWKHIDEQIDRSSTFIQYKNWTHSVTGSTLTQASSEFSPEIDKWITSYLTPTSLSMQRQEISQAIWYTSQLINNYKDLGLQPNSTELSYSTERFDLTEQFDSIEHSDLTEVSDLFIEDTVDAPAILLSELISATKVKSIIEIWEITRHRHSAKNSIYAEQLFSDLLFPIQTGLDAGTHAIQELKNFMNSFILKHAPKKKKKQFAKKCQNIGQNRAGCKAWHERQ
ncbi:25521_t:CDS:2, partial [Gigaspora rosea]